MASPLESLKTLPLFKTPVLPGFGRFPLNGIVANAGHESVRHREYRFHGLKRGDNPFAVFQMTLSGWGALDYEGHRMRIDPGSAHFVVIPHDHCYYFSGEASHWEFVYICLSGEEFLRQASHLIRTAGPVFHSRDYPLMARTFRDILGHVQGNAGIDGFYLSGCVYTLLMDMISRTDLLQSDLFPSSDNAYIDFTLDFIETHLEEPFSIEQIADQLGINRSHLSRVFRKRKGIPLKIYIENLKMEKAVRLLIESSLPVSEIGRRCGYEDFNYFCRVFRKRFAQSPGQYRREYTYLYE